MTDFKKNDIFEAACEGYSSDGSGVVRIDGRAVFVKGLLLGESAKIRILKAGRTAVYGKIESIDTPSESRIAPDCAVYGKCGGCALRHMAYDEELRLKLRRVNDAFKRIGGLSLEASEIIGAENICGYRNKTIYSVGMESGRAATGFYRQRSHDLIPAPNCAIESDYAARAAAALRGYMDEYKVKVFSEQTGRGIRRLMCRFGFKSGEGQTVIVTGEGKIPQEDKLIEKILEACPETVSIMRNINSDPGDTVLSRNFSVLWGKDHIDDELMGLRFSLAPDAFYQVNRSQAEKLYKKAIEYAELDKDCTALDLYCGTGTITLCLAGASGKAVGVEIVESAIKNAKINAERNGVSNAEFICADAPEAAEKLRKGGLKPDVVVVDPPRKGLSPETPAIVASMEPKRIVYVSCDPATLARDLKLFDELGYKARKATAVDMFPRTAHVETVVFMERI